MERIIDNGSTQNPYREYVYTIAPLESVKVDYAFNYFRVLELSGSSDLKVRFGGSGSETDFIGTGIGYDAELAYPFVIMRNASATDTMVIRIAIGMGVITDDRVNFVVGSGLPVVNAPSTQLETFDKQASSFASAQVTMTAATAVQIFAADANRKAAVITAGNQDLYINTSNAVTNTNSFKIPAGQSITVGHGLAVWGYCVNADTAFKYEETY